MNYFQHSTVAQILEPWVEALQGDEWGEFMVSLLSTYRDSDMLNEEEQDYLYGMLVEQFRAIDFPEVVFDYRDVSLSDYKRLIVGYHATVERQSKARNWNTNETRQDEVADAVSQLPDWMKAVKTEDLPEWITQPKYPTKEKVLTILGGYEADDDVTQVIKAFYRELS